MVATATLTAGLGLVVGTRSADGAPPPIIDAQIIGTIFGTPVFQVLGSGFGRSRPATLVTDENGASTGFLRVESAITSDNNGNINETGLIKVTAACFIDITAFHEDGTPSNTVRLQKPNCTPPSLTLELSQPAGTRPGLAIYGARFTPFEGQWVTVATQSGIFLTEGATTADGNGAFSLQVISFGREACGQVLEVTAVDEATSVYTTATIQTNPC